MTILNVAILYSPTLILPLPFLLQNLHDPKVCAGIFTVGSLTVCAFILPVNPANERMLGGGGANGAIHDAAHPELTTSCYDVPEIRPGVCCPTGEARVTPFRNSLRVARENNIQYVAFPAISCGVFGYPYVEAATVAISTIKEHCNPIIEVHFVLFTDDIFNVWVKKAVELLPV